MGDQVDQIAVRGTKRGDATDTQLSLPGFDAVPLPTDGLFFALFPDTRSAARIEQIAQHVCSQQRGSHAPAPLGLDRYHVTLHHLGNYAGGLPQKVVARAMRAASTVSTGSFAVAFDRAEDFHGRPLVLRAHEDGLALIAFRFALGKALESAGFAGRTRAPFTPHVTLTYRNPRDARRRFVEHLDEPVSWPVQDFVLVHSLLGRSRYVALARWPLRATT
jgi:2'-5' RNA ligase